MLSFTYVAFLLLNLYILFCVALAAVCFLRIGNISILGLRELLVEVFAFATISSIFDIATFGLLAFAFVTLVVPKIHQ